MAKQKTSPKITKLKKHYRIGKKALKECEASGGVYGKGIIKKLAEDEEMPELTVEKCRQFARLYEQEEFDKLCKLRTPAGEPIGWGHVTRLLPVKNKRRRMSLQRRIAKEGWSTRHLEQQASLKRTKKRSRGRPFQVATTRKEAYVKMASMCDQWLRWAGDFASEPKDDEKVVWLDDMPKKVIKKINSVERAMKRLRKEVDGLLG